MPNSTSPISSNLDQVYAHQQVGKAPPITQAADSVPDIIKRADGSIALEIIQSLLPTAFPAVVPGDGASPSAAAGTSAFNPPPEVGNLSEVAPAGGTVNALA